MLWHSAKLSTHASASSQMPAMMVTASLAYAPAAVSPDSMTQSVPSRTALATSVASARVGLGLVIIESSICVAVTTGLPARLQRRIMDFCTQNIFSSGISMPRSPRATMMPSDSRRMSSKLASPSWFSTLAMMRMPVGGELPHTSSAPAPFVTAGLAAAAASTARMARTSEPLRTNEAAMKSTLFLAPQLTKSSSSFSVSVGRSTTTPGRFTFLRSPSLAVLRQTHSTSPAARSMRDTCSSTAPSAIRMRPPTATSRARCLYDTATRDAVPRKP